VYDDVVDKVVRGCGMSGSQQVAGGYGGTLL
jgi:hypothetical protein